MVVWHHNSTELEQGDSEGDGERQRSLACCSPWDHKELDSTYQPKDSIV